MTKQNKNQPPKSLRTSVHPLDSSTQKRGSKRGTRPGFMRLPPPPSSTVFPETPCGGPGWWGPGLDGRRRERPEVPTENRRMNRERERGGRRLPRGKTGGGRRDKNGEDTDRKPVVGSPSQRETGGDSDGGGGARGKGWRPPGGRRVRDFDSPGWGG